MLTFLIRILTRSQPEEETKTEEKENYKKQNINDQLSCLESDINDIKDSQKAFIEHLGTISPITRNCNLYRPQSTKHSRLSAPSTEFSFNLEKDSANEIEIRMRAFLKNTDANICKINHSSFMIDKKYVELEIIKEKLMYLSNDRWIPFEEFLSIYYGHMLCPTVIIEEMQYLKK